MKIYIFFLILFFQQINCDLLTINSQNKKAIEYVGINHSETGRAQLDILLNEGLKQNDYVLEIGCGALVAAIPIISFLYKKHYCGIEPNKWLIDSSLEIDQNKRIYDEKKPIFLHNLNFDASETNINFDYILAHSIMSHAAHWQLPLFLKNCSRVLKNGGKLIFSIRLTQPNEFGNPGSNEESKSDVWVYPSNTFFAKETIIKEAQKYFRTIRYEKSYTRLITASDKSAFHDWFVLIK